MGWKVEYYQRDNGSEPVFEFIDMLPAKHAAKALWEIDLLEKFGTALRMPYSKAVEGDKYKGLFELRIQQGSDISRIFYVLPVGNKFILLHGFLKKGRKTPQKELETALRYMQDYTRRVIANENT
ncbi:MAG: type II toxin-antitoxin system RelE/ParE family toxin [Oscillospiraceae bacterium]|nr:type II toxin-antitoxin system RelE/ParE family toxin [Oscillospiraceae bacterium]